MKPLSKLLNKFCGKMIMLLASLLIELIILIQKLRESRYVLSEFEEGEKVRKLKCQHTFHRDCLDKWLQQYWATCPLCRKQVLPDDVVFKHRLHQNQAEAASNNGNDDNLLYLFSAFRGGNT
ncbi:hypothetical protein AAZX31_11G240600 [Glycine max]